MLAKMLLPLILAFSAVIAGCSQPLVEVPVKTYPIESFEGIVIESGVVDFDSETSSDGNGSLRIVADGPTTIPLYESGDIDAEATTLIYRARIRTEDLQGQAFLEMWCVFPGKGEFFSRALDRPLSGTQEWTTQQTPFFLKAGENPENVKLNIVVNGTGTVWVDDLVLAKMAPAGQAQ